MQGGKSSRDVGYHCGNVLEQALPGFITREGEGVIGSGNAQLTISDWCFGPTTTWVHRSHPSPSASTLV